MLLNLLKEIILSNLERFDDFTKGLKSGLNILFFSAELESQSYFPLDNIAWKSFLNKIWLIYSANSFS